MRLGTRPILLHHRHTQLVKITILTLSAVNRLRFLALRTTFKSTILAAMLKPTNRTKVPILQPNLANPRGSISPSVLGYKPSVRACPALRFRNFKSLVFWWWDIMFLIPICLQSYRRSLLKYLRLKVCLSPCFTMAKEFNPSCLTVSESKLKSISI
jgi:hypothetical protein